MLLKVKTGNSLISAGRVLSDEKEFNKFMFFYTMVKDAVIDIEVQDGDNIELVERVKTEINNTRGDIR